MTQELVHTHDREIVGPARISEDRLKEILTRLTSKHGVKCEITGWHQSKKTSVLRYHLEGEGSSIESLKTDLKHELEPLGCDEGAA